MIGVVMDDSMTREDTLHLYNQPGNTNLIQAFYSILAYFTRNVCEQVRNTYKEKKVPKTLLSFTDGRKIEDDGTIKQKWDYLILRDLREK